MNKITRKRLAKRKQRIRRRLRKIHWEDQPRPLFSASNIHYQLADRSSGIACGGIGLTQMLARQTGLIKALDRNLQLLKLHLPYHESDHVLNLAYNILAGGTCIEDLELLRNNKDYLDAVGAVLFVERLQVDLLNGVETNHAKCPCGSQSAKDGGRRYAWFRSQGKKL